MKPEALLKLFEGDAKYLEKEASFIEDLTSMQGPAPTGEEPFGRLPPEAAWMRMRRRYGRKPAFKFWEGIEGVLTPKSFPLPDNQATSALREELQGMFAHPTEKCPDAETMVRFVNHELDSVTADHVSAHVLHCDDCAEEFVGLSKTEYEPTAHGAL